MILVTGATGTVGGHLVRLLTAAGAPTRAFVRSPESADNLRGYDVQIAEGDYAQPQSLRRALEGVDRLFLLSPVGEHSARLASAVLDAAEEVAGTSGVSPYVVKLAALGSDDPAAPIRLLREHGVVLERLRGGQLPWTALLANAFLQNLLAQAAQVQERGTLTSPVGDGRVSYVDARDIAAVAARLLTAPAGSAPSQAGEGSKYVLTGAEAVSYADIAGRFSAVLGREVAVEDIDLARYRDMVRGWGLPESTAEALVELAEYQRSGAAATVSDDVRRVTGRDPAGVEDFLVHHRAAFAAA